MLYLSAVSTLMLVILAGILSYEAVLARGRDRKANMKAILAIIGAAGAFVKAWSALVAQ
ncbi:hypothetical protein [Thioclava sp.]|uniref:hypothetical protein n=1 Tax=Thioclava sp. TaxID=1933450 RepID=UPI003242980B